MTVRSEDDDDDDDKSDNGDDVGGWQILFQIVCKQQFMSSVCCRVSVVLDRWQNGKHQFKWNRNNSYIVP